MIKIYYSSVSFPIKSCQFGLLQTFSAYWIPWNHQNGATIALYIANPPIASSLNIVLIHCIKVYLFILSLAVSLFLHLIFLTVVLFILLLNSENKINGKVSTGKLNLVDLAGSERINKSGEIIWRYIFIFSPTVIAILSYLLIICFCR